MTIVGGFDVHRAQITFDYLDTVTGEVATGQVRPATRGVLRAWLAGWAAGRGDVAFAVEGCTGWRFVVEELAAAGVEAHLAEPADTATARGRKKRAKTDRADARLLRELLAGGRLPPSWIPPAHVLEVRTLGRLYCALMDERQAWQQRMLPPGSCRHRDRGGDRNLKERAAAPAPPGTPHRPSRRRTRHHARVRAPR